MKLLLKFQFEKYFTFRLITVLNIYIILDAGYVWSLMCYLLLNFVDNNLIKQHSKTGSATKNNSNNYNNNNGKYKSSVSSSTSTGFGSTFAPIGFSGSLGGSGGDDDNNNNHNRGKRLNSCYNDIVFGNINEEIKKSPPNKTSPFNVNSTNTTINNNFTINQNPFEPCPFTPKPITKPFQNNSQTTLPNIMIQLFISTNKFHH